MTRCLETYQTSNDVKYKAEAAVEKNCYFFFVTMLLLQWIASFEVW